MKKSGFVPQSNTLRAALLEAEQHFGCPIDARISVVDVSDHRRLLSLEWVELDPDVAVTADKLICLWPRCRTSRALT